MKSTLGPVVVSKGHVFIAGSAHNFTISPLLQSHMLEFSSQLPFAQAASLLNTALPHAAVCSSQNQRLTQHFGNLAQIEALLEEPGFTLDPPKEDESPSVLYVQTDGGQLRTDEGYRETKVGRIFSAAHLVKKSSDNEKVGLRMALSHSDYIARLGGHSEFTARFDKLIEHHQRQSLGARVVFISDGAEWIRNWTASHRDALPILDFFHAAEHLADFAKLAFGAQNPMTSAWISDRHQALKKGQLLQVIRTIGNLRKDLSEDGQKQANQLIRYYFKNRYRMKYDQYQQAGLCIGSGAIESAISVLVQQRCKLVGQRWTDRVTAVLSIRSVFKSGKREKLRALINQQMACMLAA